MHRATQFRDGRATHIAAVQIVAERGGTVHGAPIVPHDEVALLPAVTVDERRLCRDRKSVVQGKSVSVGVDLGGRSIIEKITTKKERSHNKKRNIKRTI